MSLSTRLDKLEAAMRGRDRGEPGDGLIRRRLIYDPSESQNEEDEAISRMKLRIFERNKKSKGGGVVRGVAHERVP
jgi:hypothetical protein